MLSQIHKLADWFKINILLTRIIGLVSQRSKQSPVSNIPDRAMITVLLPVV